MKYIPILKSLLLATAGAMLLSGCVVRERVVYRQPPPAVAPDEVVVTSDAPPPIVETVVVAPGPGYYWVRGEWVWRGRWVWAPGRWVYPPRPGAHWRAAHCEVRGGARVYIRGGWAF